MKRKLSGSRALAIAIVSLALLVVGGATVALAMVDLRYWLERAASKALDRATHIGSLHIEWGRHITVEARDVSVANPAWAREAAFLQIGRLYAVIDPLALLRGVVRYEKLRLKDVVLSLERDVDSAATWKFGGQGSNSKGGLALVPKNRSQFPTVLDFLVENARIVYRSAKKSEIEIVIERGTISAASEDTPVQLVVNGSYNGESVRIAGSSMDTFKTLRDASLPYKAILDVIAKPVVLHFQGTLTEPLDFDGVSGPLRIDVPSLHEALKLFDVEKSPAVSLQIASALQRQGDRWQLGGATGQLSASPFSGDLVLDEGKRGQADRLHLEVDFPTLDIGQMLMAGNASSRRGTDEPAMFVEGQVRAAQMNWGKARLSDVVLRGSTGPRDSRTGNLTFDFYGGKVQARMETVDDGGRIAVDASISGADFSRVAALIGITGGRVTGKLAVRINLDFPNRAGAGALATGQGRAAMAVTGGSIASEILAEASTDLLALFRKKGMVPVTCLFGAGTVRDGIVHLEPLRLRASDVALHGSGWVDLLRHRLSIIIQARSGASFALDRPLHIEGSLTNPSIGPFRGGAAPKQETAPLAPQPQTSAIPISC
jgi:AsmA family protein